MVQMLSAQRLGDDGGLTFDRRRESHLDLAAGLSLDGDEASVLTERLDRQAAGGTEDGRDAARRLQHGVGTTSGRAQGEDRGGRPGGTAEPHGKLGDAPDVRPTKGVDRLVGVADDHQVATVARDGLQQTLLRRVGVLVLVDDHEVVLLAQPGASDLGLGVGDRADDQLGVVEQPPAVHDVEVLDHERGGGTPVLPVGGE